MIVVKSNDSILNAFVGYFGLDAILISVAVLVILVASCIYCYRRIYWHYGMYDNVSKLLRNVVKGREFHHARY